MDKLKLNFSESINEAFNLPVSFYTYVLKEEVQPALLQDAVNQALAYHPIFKTVVIKEGAQYYYQANDLPAVVSEIDLTKPLRLRSREVNFYPWLVVCSGKKIIYTGMHSVADGTGINMFMGTVLRLYLQLTGVSFSTALSLEREDSRKTEDAFGANDDPSAKAAYTAEKKRSAVAIPRQLYRTDYSSPKIQRFILDEAEIRAAAKKNGSSISVVISRILLRALDSVLQLDTGIISLNLTANIRRFTESITDRNHTLSTELLYDMQKHRNLSDDILEEELKKHLDCFLDKNNVFSAIHKQNKLDESIRRFPFLFRIIKFFAKNMVFSDRARIIYTHITRLDYDAELCAHLEDFYVDAKGYQKGLIVVMGASYHGKIQLTISDWLKDTIFFDSIEKVLAQSGFHYQIVSSDPLPDREFCEGI